MTLIETRLFDIYNGIVPHGRNSSRFTSAILSETEKIADEARRKDWISTSRWNPKAESTGLLAELAFHKAMGTLASQVVDDFMKGLYSDQGADWVTPQGKEVDVKSTRGRALRFKFNRRNKFAHKAQIVAFAKVDEQDNEAIVTLLGWSWKADINLYLHHDERYDFVNFETLRREGLVNPVAMLKEI